MNDSTQRYTKTAIILHWVIGFMIFGMFALGWYMSELPKDSPKAAVLDLFDLGLYTLQFAEPLTPRTFYFNLHKSIGVTLLALIAFRVFWRLANAAPTFPATMREWEKKAADIAHMGLYVLMVAMPVSGIIMASYSKYGVKWFGVKLIAGLDNTPMRELFQEVHEAIGAILLAVIVVHVIAAIKHKVVDKDDVMKRMSLRG
jgi:cytochrome b561